MKLHLGCGEQYLEGYVNIDKYPQSISKVDRSFDCDLPLDYADDSIEEILTIHMLEHLKRTGLNRVVKSWYRVLKPGGKLIIETPNMLVVFHMYIDKVINGTDEEVKESLRWVYGNQERSGQQHFWGWSPPTLKKLLQEVGFEIINILPAEDDTRPQELSFRTEAVK